MKKEKFKDQLKVEGVFSKGFGHIAKFVSTDIDLTIEALAIYGYFSSFAGGGNSAFPSRKKILYDLNIGKERYYNHYNLLLAEGYITTERERYYHKDKNKYVLGNNIYTLISNPKKFEDRVLKKNENKEKKYSRIRNNGMKSLGYGTVPKAIMLDRRLDIKAKGIYIYFCSFAGSGNSAFPKLENILYHLQISESTYYKYYKELINLNYIEVEQRQINGRLGINDYYLNEKPDEEIAKQIAQSKEKPLNKPKPPFPKNQDIENQDIEKQDIEEQDIEEQDIYNNNSPITNSSNSNSININSHSINQEQEEEKNNLEDKKKAKYNIREIERLSPTELKEIVTKELKEEKTIPYRYTQSSRVMETAIKILTGYDEHIEWFKANQYSPKGMDFLYTEGFKLFNETLAEMLTTEKMVLKGSYVTYAKVYDKIIEDVEITDERMHLGSITDNAVNDYKEASKEIEIYSPMDYMKSVIWNSLITSNIKITSDVKRRWGNW